jgi:hypothetical protein
MIEKEFKPYLTLEKLAIGQASGESAICKTLFDYFDYPSRVRSLQRSDVANAPYGHTRRSVGS